MFVGVHERQLDDKGRLALPSAFRALLGDSCYLVYGQDRCINVLSAETFESDALALIERVNRGEESITRRRALAHSATRVTLDKQGRVTIDEKLRSYARLVPGSKVVVAGNFDRAELWSPDVYEQIAAESRGLLAGGRE